MRWDRHGVRAGLKFRWIRLPSRYLANMEVTSRPLLVGACDLDDFWLLSGYQAKQISTFIEQILVHLPIQTISHSAWRMNNKTEPSDTKSRMGKAPMRALGEHYEQKEGGLQKSQNHNLQFRNIYGVLDIVPKQASGERPVGW